MILIIQSLYVFHDNIEENSDQNPGEAKEPGEHLVCAWCRRNSSVSNMVRLEENGELVLSRSSQGLSKDIVPKAPGLATVHTYRYPKKKDEPKWTVERKQSRFIHKMVAIYHGL